MMGTEVQTATLTALPVPPADLAALAARINAEHAKCEAAAKTGLAHAFEVGRLLLEVKGRLAHGAWLPWVKENCSFSARTAQAYLRVTKHPELKSAETAHLTLSGALKQIAAPELRVRDYSQNISALSDAMPHLEKALAAAETVQDLKAVRDVALEAQNVAAEIRLRCERSAGSLLKEMAEPTPDLLEQIYAGVLEPAHFEAARWLEEEPIFAGAMKSYCADIGETEIKDWTEACVFLNGSRPLDHPIIWFGGEPVPEIISACRVFVAWISTSEERNAEGQKLVPSWKVCAFWWLSATVFLRLSSNHLAIQIRGFIDGLKHAAVWWDIENNYPHGTKDKRFWGCWSDLNHAGVMTRVKELKEDPLFGSWIEDLIHSGQIEPSTLQRRHWRTEEENNKVRSESAGQL